MQLTHCNLNFLTTNFRIVMSQLCYYVGVFKCKRKSLRVFAEEAENHNMAGRKNFDCFDLFLIRFLIR